MHSHGMFQSCTCDKYHVMKTYRSLGSKFHIVTQYVVEVTSQVHAVGTSFSWIEAPSTCYIGDAQHLYLFCISSITECHSLLVGIPTPCSEGQEYLSCILNTRPSGSLWQYNDTHLSENVSRANIKMMCCIIQRAIPKLHCVIGLLLSWSLKRICMRIGVLMLMDMKATALRSVMPCSLVESHQCFSKYIYLQSKIFYPEYGGSNLLRESVNLLPILILPN
jgi:hypothetical protein